MLDAQATKEVQCMYCIDIHRFRKSWLSIPVSVSLANYIRITNLEFVHP